VAYLQISIMLSVLTMLNKLYCIALYRKSQTVKTKTCQFVKKSYEAMTKQDETALI
jgi:hypothetical protein